MSIQIPWAPGAKYIHVTCRLGEPRPDADDADDFPDLMTQGGTVTLKCDASRVRYDEEDGRRRMLTMKTWTFNIRPSDGELYSPDSGAVGVYVLSGLSEGMDPSGWTWSATVTPKNGDPWQATIPAIEGDFDLVDGADVIAPSAGESTLASRVAALESAPPEVDATGQPDGKVLTTAAGEAVWADPDAPDLSGLVQDTDPRLSDARTPTAHDHDDRYYTEAEVDTLISGVQAVSAQNYQAMLSRGENLVTNGTGFLGDNTNFPWAIFDKPLAPEGVTGVFVNPGGVTTGTVSELIPVRLGAAYHFAYQIRETVEGKTSQYRSYIQPLDAYDQLISPYHYMFFADTTTTLAQDLEPGDTEIKLTDPANWYGTTGKPANALTHYRSMIIWNYVDPGGKTWPEHTYSRNWSGANAWPDGGIAADGTITLLSPWPASNGTIPAGTKVSNGLSGGTYIYRENGLTISADDGWVLEAGNWRLNPAPTVTSSDGRPVASFAGGWVPPGTVQIRLGWLLNSGSDAGSRQAIGGVVFSEVSDHGALAGLTDDDHQQYALADGTRGVARVQGSNIGIGNNSQSALTTGAHNVATGHNTQSALTEGFNNVAVGRSAQSALTEGFNNVAVGASAQIALTVGARNLAVGVDAQRELTMGMSNVGIGTAAQSNLTTGSNNVAIGHNAQRSPTGVVGHATTSASRQVSVGHESGQGSAAQVDDIVTIGHRALASGNKSTSVGSGAHAVHEASVAIGSDTVTTALGQVAVGPRDIEVQDATKGIVLQSPDGSRWRATINDEGETAWTKL